MIRFDCDYLEGAHPAILQKLIETNMDQTIGYEVDPYCEAAAEKIRAACACPGAAVHFLVGGTQTNTTVIYSLLRPWEGVLSADTGHINCHESGAIEGTGHKVIALPGQDGKLTAEMVENAFEAWKADASWEHIVKPGMVYISHPTETGTLYTLAELTALSETCRRLRLPLYLDGARLGYGLAAEGTDITLPDVARLCDIFYIGGTKVGALFGEALVIPDPALIPDIRSLIKQRGACWQRGGCWASSSTCSLPTACISSWGSTPWIWPAPCGRASPQRAIPLCATAPPISSSPSSPMSRSSVCPRTFPSTTTAPPTRTTATCASAQAGPPPRKTCASCWKPSEQAPPRRRDAPAALFI